MRRALDLALSTSTDQRLQAAWVVQVEPAPDASRLRVQIASREAAPDALRTSLRSAAGWLRAEAAQAIHRKRAPDLLLEVAPPEEGP